MKESEDGTSSPSYDAAWNNLQIALEMYEGELWRTELKTKELALIHLRRARAALEISRDRLLQLDGSSFR